MKNKIKFIVTLILFIIVSIIQTNIKIESTILNFCLISIINLSIGTLVIYYYHQLKK